MDPHHRYTSGWLAAQDTDGACISDDGAAATATEDLAETMVAYRALCSGRVGTSLVTVISETIPNWVRFLDCSDLSLDLLE